MKSKQPIMAKSGVIVILLTLIGLTLRFINLNQGLWYDEIIALVRFIRLPLRDLLTTYTSENQHMLYSVLAHLSIVEFGEHIWSLRLPAVVFGVASIPALYLLGKTITSRWEALLATALMTVSYHHVWFSQNARGYTGLLFWTLVGTYLFLRGLQQNRINLWIGYGIAMALGIYTHLTMVFVLLSHAIVFVWQLYSDKNKGELVKTDLKMPLIGFGLTGLFTALLYAPILPQMVAHFGGGGTIPSQWTEVFWAISEAIRGLKVGFAKGVLGVLGLLVAGFFFTCGLWSYAKENRKVFALLVLPGLLGAVPLTLLEHNIWPRFFFYTLGFILLIAVRGAMVVGKLIAGLQVGQNSEIYGMKIGSTIIGLLIGLSLASLPFAYQYPKQDYEGAMNFVEKVRKPSDLVVTVGLAAVVYEEYYKKNWEVITTVEQLNQIRAQAPETWLIYAFPIFVESRYPEVMAAIFKDFTPVKIFPGTLGGGEIYVCKSNKAS
ncbi:MAG TPA: glycosyltransferase family 39 protein [Candidatus Limnocylindrales bacterium]|nr:glycosyltransferase family 39 protein [Candidatus Limnocylindrales bacterium]